MGKVLLPCCISDSRCFLPCNRRRWVIRSSWSVGRIRFKERRVPFSFVFFSSSLSFTHTNTHPLTHQTSSGLLLTYPGSKMTSLERHRLSSNLAHLSTLLHTLTPYTQTRSFDFSRHLNLSRPLQSCRPCQTCSCSFFARAWPIPTQTKLLSAVYFLSCFYSSTITLRHSPLFTRNPRLVLLPLFCLSLISHSRSLDLSQRSASF